jgi:hypothetical protein
VEEAPRGQLIDDAPVERRLFVELEVGEVFLMIGQVGELQVQRIRPGKPYRQG